MQGEKPKNFEIFLGNLCAGTTLTKGTHIPGLAYSAPLRVKDIFCSIDCSLRQGPRLVSLVRVVHILFLAQSESVYQVGWGLLI